jgi:ABC-type polysaccharide/polyol phosphate transport system ATPase subunit
MMRAKILSDKTIVLVSHNPSTIRELCNQAVWIENGVTQAEGETEDVIQKYEYFLRDAKNVTLNSAVGE